MMVRTMQSNVHFHKSFFRKFHAGALCRYGHFRHIFTDSFLNWGLTQKFLTTKTVTNLDKLIDWSLILT